MNDVGIIGHLLSNTPNVIITAIMTYDFTGIMCHTLRFSASMVRMRLTFLTSILTNIVENKIRVTTQPTIIPIVVASQSIHDTTPILHTLKPAISHIMPAIKASDLVFIFFFVKTTYRVQCTLHPTKVDKFLHPNDSSSYNFSHTSVFCVKNIENFAEWKYYGIFV